MNIAVITHPDCIRHDPGLGHPEQPERVKVIQSALLRYPFKAPLKLYEAPQATTEQLSAVHDADYINWLATLSPLEGNIGIDADTVMNPYTLNAALHAAGAVILAVDLVMQEDAKVAFCNIRPPGHHAEKDRAMGFCFFNNVAVGVAYALKQYGLERIAIIDFDVHHGNGTQHIFQDDERVLYCSIFEHPFYPGYEVALDNAHILSVPLPAGTSSSEFREKVQEAWFEQIASFKPQLIFFSAGFDAHADDPLADLQLTEADYVWLTQKIAQLANVYCQGKMISALEGGYNLDVLARCVPAHVNAMISF